MLAQRGCYCFSLAVGKLGGGGGRESLTWGLEMFTSKPFYLTSGACTFCDELFFFTPSDNKLVSYT